MKLTSVFVSLAVVASGVLAAPPPPPPPPSSAPVPSPRPSGVPPPPPPASVNPFANRDFYVNPVYADKVVAEAQAIAKRGDKTLAKRALKVAAVPTFVWVSEFAAVPSISGHLKKAKAVQKRTGKKQLVQLVVYNLPDRDCGAKASSGELDLAKGGEERYKDFIHDVVAQIKSVPGVDVAVQLETDAIGNIVGNQNLPKCANAAPAHIRSMAYGIAKLQIPGVSIYLDGAHAAWLGWPDNLGPTAKALSSILNAAKVINPKSKVRGVATDVSNYNGLGNQEQDGRDELKYIKNLAPLLEAEGFPAHFIVDQGRSGNQMAIREGGDWCNFKEAGFGPRPTANTNEPLVDAIVWVKGGGEADGTSDPTAERFDEACGSETSLKPAPEAGAWFPLAFETSLKNANPAF